MDMQEAQVKHIKNSTSKYEATQSLHSCIILNFFRALFVLDVPMQARLDVETGATILFQVSYPHSFWSISHPPEHHENVYSPLFILLHFISSIATILQPISFQCICSLLDTANAKSTTIYKSSFFIPPPFIINADNIVVYFLSEVYIVRGIVFLIVKWWKKQVRIYECIYIFQKLDNWEAGWSLALLLKYTPHDFDAKTALDSSVAFPNFWWNWFYYVVVTCMWLQTVKKERISKSNNFKCRQKSQVLILSTDALRRNGLAWANKFVLCCVQYVVCTKFTRPKIMLRTIN